MSETPQTPGAAQAPETGQAPEAVQATQTDQDQRLKWNWWGFLFTWIWYFYKGIWAKGFAILAAQAVLFYTTSPILEPLIENSTVRALPAAIIMGLYCGRNGNSDAYIAQRQREKAMQ